MQGLCPRATWWCRLCAAVAAASKSVGGEGTSPRPSTNWYHGWCVAAAAAAKRMEGCRGPRTSTKWHHSWFADAAAAAAGIVEGCRGPCPSAIWCRFAAFAMRMVAGGRCPCISASPCSCRCPKKWVLQRLTILCRLEFLGRLLLHGPAPTLVKLWTLRLCSRLLWQHSSRRLHLNALIFQSVCFLPHPLWHHSLRLRLHGLLLWLLVSCELTLLRLQPQLEVSLVNLRHQPLDVATRIVRVERDGRARHLHHIGTKLDQTSKLESFGEAFTENNRHLVLDLRRS
mmetsp:Transcript_161152/g.517283  ORF Transcript_161152/g.517283 Transcript_161152/m.517283 type:complete len:285 (-) Transcript_161152:2802-3656(-)